MSNSKYYVFIGNPGSGKSTTVNAAVQSIVCKSGVSTNGYCVTETYQEIKVDLPGLKGIVIDTPGLADINSRVLRAAEIEKALKKDADYAVFFVNRLVDGRLMEQDITTMRSVVDACPTMQFSVIVTQVSEGVEMASATGQVRELLETLFPRLQDVNNAYYIIPEIASARKQENALLPPDQSRALQMFMRNAPLGRIQSKDVGKIKSSEEEVKKLREEVKEAQAQAERMLREYEAKSKALREELKSKENELNAQIQQIQASQMANVEKESRINQLMQDLERQQQEIAQRQQQLDAQKQKHKKGGFWRSLGEIALRVVETAANKFVGSFFPGKE